MAIKKYYQNAKCPHYRKDIDIRLICEGATSDMSAVHLVFPNREKLLKYRRDYCCGSYETCSIEQAIEKREMTGE
jgi:hypothetical protein